MPESKVSENPLVWELVQLSDTHLLAQAEGALLGLATRDSLQRVLDLVRKTCPQVDLVLATGDLSQDGSLAAYQHLRHQLEPLARFVRWCPGNHDVRVLMDEVALGTDFMQPVVDLGPWRIIVLDSQQPGVVWGYLAPEQLAFLAQALADAAGRYCMVCLHHHPVQVGSRWMDDIGLRNAPALFEVLAAYPQVRALLWGHVHQEFDQLRGDLRLLAAPSTCVQFEPKQETFQLAVKPPGFRWVRLHADGRFETQVRRVTGVVLGLDCTSSGY